MFGFLHNIGSAVYRYGEWMCDRHGRTGLYNLFETKVHNVGKSIRPLNKYMGKIKLASCPLSTKVINPRWFMER